MDQVNIIMFPYYYIILSTRKNNDSSNALTAVYYDSYQWKTRFDRPFFICINLPFHRLLTDYFKLYNNINILFNVKHKLCTINKPSKKHIQQNFDII